MAGADGMGLGKLDELINNLAFENQQLVKLIEKENQLITGAQTGIQKKKEHLKIAEEEIKKLDVDIKVLYKQFNNQRETIKNLKSTRAILIDHEIALCRQLKRLKIENESKRQAMEEQLTHYKQVHNSYMNEYKSDPLAMEIEKQQTKIDELNKQLEKVKEQQQKVASRKLDLQSQLEICSWAENKKIIVKIAETWFLNKNQEEELTKMLKKKQMLIVRKKQFLDEQMEIQTKNEERQSKNQPNESSCIVPCHENRNKTMDKHGPSVKAPFFKLSNKAQAEAHPKEKRNSNQLPTMNKAKSMLQSLKIAPPKPLPKPKLAVPKLPTISMPKFPIIQAPKKSINHNLSAAKPKVKSSSIPMPMLPSSIKPQKVLTQVLPVKRPDAVTRKCQSQTPNPSMLITQQKDTAKVKENHEKQISKPNKKQEALKIIKTPNQPQSMNSGGDLKQGLSKKPMDEALRQLKIKEQKKQAERDLVCGKGDATQDPKAFKFNAPKGLVLKNKSQEPSAPVFKLTPSPIEPRRCQGGGAAAPESMDTSPPPLPPAQADLEQAPDHFSFDFEQSEEDTGKELCFEPPEKDTSDAGNFSFGMLSKSQGSENAQDCNSGFNFNFNFDDNNSDSGEKSGNNFSFLNFNEEKSGSEADEKEGNGFSFLNFGGESGGSDESNHSFSFNTNEEDSNDKPFKLF